MGQPVVSWIEHHAARTPDRVALIDLHRGSELSYGELAARVRAVAWSLQDRSAWVPATGWPCCRATTPGRSRWSTPARCSGPIAVPLNWRLTAAELTAVSRDAEPAVLVHENWAEPVAAAIANGAGVPTRVAWASEDDGDDTYEELATAAVPADWVPPEVDDEAVWTIIYTSGTTGLPKGARPPTAAAGQHARHPRGPPGQRRLRLPDGPAAFHVAGLNLFANPVLYVGGTVMVARAFDPAQRLALLTDTATPVTHFCGVPANYQFMEQLPEFADAPLRPFVAVVGGSPVPQALVETWGRRGVALTTVYGITEAGRCVTAMPPGRELDHNGTVGLPLLYARCRVRTTDGRAAAPGETGELQLSGPLVTPGYWRNPAATAEALTNDGWLHTGDAATITDDGHLVLVDRWKDMYISGGENVYPAEIENALHAHPAVNQAAVVGAPHPRWGEAGVAFVVLARGAEVSPDDLRAWCRERLAAYKVPVRVIVVDELPRNATGKVLKGPLRESAHGATGG